MRYFELTFTLPVLASEAIAWALQEAGVAGVVLDQRTPDMATDAPATLRAYLADLPETVTVPRALEAATNALGLFDPSASMTSETREVEEEDWANSWRRFWHVMRIGRHLVVKPTWETHEPEVGDLVITLDPQQAFGTGTHATTQLCMRALEEVASHQPLGTVHDVGSGSGILAITACLLGARAGMAVDIDPVAVHAARENIAANGFAARIQCAIGGPEAISEPADTVVANILAEVIIELGGELARITRPGGTLVASGILGRKADAVSDALAPHGFRHQETVPEGDWVGMVFARL
jgi:ribosomal protein L11 methyltransferase